MIGQDPTCVRCGAALGESCACDDQTPPQEPETTSPLDLVAADATDWKQVEDLGASTNPEPDPEPPPPPPLVWDETLAEAGRTLGIVDPTPDDVLEEAKRIRARLSTLSYGPKARKRAEKVSDTFDRSLAALHDLFQNMSASLGIQRTQNPKDLTAAMRSARNHLNVLVYGDSADRDGDSFESLLGALATRPRAAVETTVAAPVTPVERTPLVRLTPPLRTPAEELVKDHAPINAWNENGLVNGTIPKATGCPFEADCPTKTPRCPTEKNLLPHAFSCARARLASLAQSLRKQGLPAPKVDP